MYTNQSYSSMFAQAGGGTPVGATGGGGPGPTAAASTWGLDQQYNATGQQYAMNGQLAAQQQRQQYPQMPHDANVNANATSSLFQQQLAQQQRIAQNPSANSFLASAQPYAQNQQQVRTTLPQPSTSSAPQNSNHFATSAHSPGVLPSQIAAQNPQYSNQASQLQQQQQQPQQQRQLTSQELVNILRGVNIQGMNAQLYATLTPLQQYAMREYMVRSRSHQAQQQAQLGLGLPGANPATPKTPAAAQNVLSNDSAVPQNRPPQPTTQAQSASHLNFLKLLRDFYNKRGIPLQPPPVIEGRPLDLPKLYAAVTATGGFVNTNSRRLWGTVASALQFPAANSNEHPQERLQQIASAYHSVLYAFEQSIAQMQLQRLQAARAAGRPDPASSAAAAPTASLNNGSSPTTVVPQTPRSNAELLPSRADSLPIQPQSVSTPPIATQSPLLAPSAPFPVHAATTNPSYTGSQSPAKTEFSVPSPKNKRPGSASSRRDSLAPQDLKGKGRASVDSANGSLKVEDFAVKTPVANVQASTPVLRDAKLSESPRPATAKAAERKPSMSLEQQEVDPEPLAPPHRRKRQKIQYVPTRRTEDAVLGYDLPLLEEAVQQAVARKRPRTAYDLGTVDIHSLTMSLRSRLASEVSFALNSLTLISMSIRTHPQEPNSIPFPIKRCQDLYEELIDLLEETAFGDEGGLDVVEEDEETDNFRSESSLQPDTYPDLFQLACEEAGRLEAPCAADKPSRISHVSPGHASLRPVETMLSVTNILRNLSIAEDNATQMSRDPRLLEVLVRIANLPLSDSRSSGSRYPVTVAAIDLLTLKKDVLELLVNFDTSTRLEDHDPATSRSLFDLLTFFLLDAHRHASTHFDLSRTPGSASRLSQPPSLRIAPYVDLALGAFARLTLLDANRSLLSRLAPHDVLARLFESLVRLVPVSEGDFQILTHETGLVYVENLVMALYNLTYLSPPELKLELRTHPAYIRSLMRVVRRLAGSGSSDSAAATFQPLIERCIATLHLLSTLGGVAVGSTGIDSSELPWWGMSMSGWEEDDENELTTEDGGRSVRVRRAQPTEQDRGTVKQKLPPSASAAAGLDAGLPILSGDTKVLFDLLDSRSMVSVFGSLVKLL
ncbi:ARID/BRIGHT DNA-binding domain-containing protein [Sporobolomyces koalae]|uniref:ARID/BRIGHT DNA-binding domain-containing protein n=1 Tax=Sporobolomyces koalae TaxID=500713 RepID=UPI0031818DEC